LVGQEFEGEGEGDHGAERVSDISIWGEGATAHGFWSGSLARQTVDQAGKETTLQNGRLTSLSEDTNQQILWWYSLVFTTCPSLPANHPSCTMWMRYLRPARVQARIDYYVLSRTPQPRNHELRKMLSRLEMSIREYKLDKEERRAPRKPHKR
jgi:hypothetical protein